MLQQIINTAGVSSSNIFEASSALIYTAGDATAEVKVLSAGRSYVDLSYKVRRFILLFIYSLFT